MKNVLRRWGALLLALLLVSAVCLLFSCRKSGMFIDEIYSYGLSNSHNAPFFDDAMGGNLVNTLITRQDFVEYLAVEKGEGFDFASVYTNQVADVHPPLYYWLLNMVCSLTPGVFSKWSGLVLDYIIYMAALVLLYVWCMDLFNKRSIAVSAVLMYGLSLLGLNTMLMIRMYVLMTMLTVLLCLLMTRLMREDKNSLYIGVGVTVFLGLLTQYYFVFYAFFICAAFVFYKAFRKEWKSLLKFALFAFVGVGLFVLVFPACFEHLFADKLVSGGNAVENLKDASQYKDRILFFVGQVRQGSKGAIYFALLLIVCCIPFLKGLGPAIKEKRISFESLLFIIPAFVTLILVALISPVLEQRYVYNIVPSFILAVCLLMNILSEILPDFSWKKLLLWAFTGCCCLICVWFARLIPPTYVYTHYIEYDTLASRHSNDPCVYMNDGSFVGITQDIQQLMFFEDVFVTDRADSPALHEYLSGKGESDECVVYFDVNEYWSSGYDPNEYLPQLIENTEYTDYELLYKNALTETYLLTKSE